MAQHPGGAPGSPCDGPKRRGILGLWRDIGLSLQLEANSV